MKLFSAYLKQHIKLIIAAVGCAAIFAVCFALYHLPLMAVVYPVGLSLLLIGLLVLRDYKKVKAKHRLLCALNEISVADALPAGDGIDDIDYARIIELLAESREQLRMGLERSFEDMQDYYTVWTHQIKTPIAAMRLSLQSVDDPKARRLLSELGRIEHYVEMAMVYLRLGSDTTDYVIREHELDAIIRRSVRKFAGEFIDRKISLEFEPTGQTVVSDEKWLRFVIEQVLSNALKYTPAGSVRIYMTQPKTLCIRDTGIGIAPEDLPRIFEKGYTGYNGRADAAASGLGLYLCKGICRRLGHGINAVSEPDCGTEIRIDLAQTELEVE